ncbi:MAG: peptidoglycan DD-metalloendopeptidase family protein [Lachnospiraceae bacterium]|nr:peptidoglycan DD-metalloendopeptidase family protein [Lachnospiraceae bacterium]
MQDQFEVTLKPSRHKRRITQHVLITSDDANSTTTAISYNPKVLLIVIVALCAVIGGLIGVIYFEKQQIELGNSTISEREAEIASLNISNSNLNSEIDSLNNKIRVLSDTVNTKTENEAELAEALDAQWIPIDFPLTGSARLNSSTDAENPMLLLQTADGSTVVATAAGVVEDIAEDENYGNVVVVNHGNGYKSFYRNRGQVMVNKGDDVVSGTTLYIISSDNERLCYQISYNGEYIDPMEMLDING